MKAILPMFAVLVIGAASSNVLAAELVIGTYNIQSDAKQSEIDHDKVSSRFASLPRADIWVTTETQSKEILLAHMKAIEQAHDGEWDGLASSTGTYTSINFPDDRIGFLYDSSTVSTGRYKISDLSEEVSRRCNARTFRAPTIVKFTHLETREQFQVVGVHLQRDENVNTCQASIINNWARDQTLPTIAIGDFNIDLNIPKFEVDPDQDGAVRPGYWAMLKDDVYDWVRPQLLAGTHCGSGSMLDFVFVSGTAKNWEGSAEVLLLDEDYCGDKQESDHLPVISRFHW